MPHPNTRNKVYLAICEGCRTTQELSDYLDVPVKICSAFVSQLHAAGKIKKIGTTRYYFSDTRRNGRLSNEWTATKKGNNNGDGTAS